MANRVGHGLRIACFFGLTLALGSCLDWEPPSRIDGDADGDVDADVDADTDSDVDSDIDATGDADDDADVEEDTENDAAGDPCSGVTCSGHGRCFDDDVEAVCVCDDGYHAVGLECVCTPDCYGRECGMDPVCGTRSCGTCTSPDERCTESTGLCEVPACAGGLLDSTSGLCWQDPPESDSRIWDSAVSYCTTLSLGGHGPGEWRLPTIGELRSLIRGCPGTETGGACGVTDDCLGQGCWNSPCGGCSALEGPGTGGAYWPAGFGGLVGWYWSSSSYGGSSSYAWIVYFDAGDVHNGSRANGHYVRCVRGGP